MKLIRVVTGLCCCVGVAVSDAAQESGGSAQTVTLAQAVERAMTNYPTLQIQRYAIEQAAAQKITAGLLPNPTLSYYREDLSLDGQNRGEQSFSAELPLNFIWTRSPLRKAAAAQVEMEQFILVDAQRLLKLETQRTFIECYYAARRYEAGQKAAAVFDQAAKAGRDRLAEGDMSGYEQQRIAVEQQRYQTAAVELQAEFAAGQRRLAFLLDPAHSETALQPVVDFQAPAAEVSFEKLLAHALQNRPDLQAARAALRGRQALQHAAKRQQLPEVSVSGGYKTQSDDFKGPVVQLNFGLPLFDRNQGGVRYTRAASEQQALHVELLEKQVALEVRQTYETYRLYRERVGQLLPAGAQAPEQILQIAQFSYAEGEMSLVELLDGVRAYSEAFQTQIALLLKYQQSIFELESAVAAAITSF